jgi:hypothetical protein
MIAEVKPVMLSPTAGRRKIGRRSKFTPEVQAILTDAVSHGVPFNAACARAGIAYRTFAEWMNDKPHFAQEIKKAEAAGMQHHLENIERAAAKTWQASAWILERRWPKLFAKTELVKIESHPDLSDIKTDVKPDVQAEAKAQQLRNIFGLISHGLPPQALVQS